MKKPEKRQPKIVSRVKIADSVTDEIRQLILSGEIADGSPLRQDALAEQMGTSRIPVREALSRLESEGLVASFPHKGYVVTGLSRSDIEELFDLRTMLEPDLIRHAIPKMTEEDLAAATAILEEYDAALLTGDVDTWGDLNRQFHMALYAPSGRAKTLDIVRGLLVNADRYTRLVLTVGYGIDKAQEDHGGLLDLCRRGLINQAVALTRDHIERTGADLLEMLDARDRETTGEPAPATA
ncbi:GntR family transcriptional regulator [Sphingopyxis macrogoltabida]|uniref:GntR family transcriptional regulator n=1 Tax=Sphingopyxis macrogoltabida TaxID=33050 RepID=UPI0006D1EB69|nr:GntR family transcriptional regulator [Sphingopyxis macrogoltabida]